MADIFLSYSSKDQGRIQPFVAVLEKQGWSVWWDYQIRIGKTFDSAIEDELTKSKCLVVLWSENSVRSDWVKTEASEAKKRQVLAPVLIDNVALPLEFRRTETANLSTWDGEDLLHPELQLLLSSVGDFINAALRNPEEEQNLRLPITSGVIRQLGGVRNLKDRFTTTQIILGIGGLLAGIVLGAVLILGLFMFPRSDRAAIRNEPSQNVDKISDDALRPNPVPTLNHTGNTATVNAPGDRFLALRSDPDAETGVRIAKIPHGTSVHVGKCHDYTLFNKTRGRWCQVSYGGQLGWAFDAYLKWN